MSAPRTPLKQRTTSPLSPAPATPPGVARVRTTSAAGRGATASPQVKAALAALRKARQASESSLNNDSPSLPSPTEAPVTPAKPSSSNGRASAGPSSDERSNAGSPARSRRREEEQVQLEWAIKDEDKLVEDAKKSGLLNLSSRSLAAIPPTLYSSLLPRTSPYHPASRQSSSFRREPTPDLRISSLAEDADGSRAATWYEQQELRSLNLSSNEIGKLDEEIGGFEDLEFLDLHNNAIPSLPPSIAWLVHLTSLNLSANSLSTFPLPLLNLRSLRDLDLSHNNFTTLWPAEWKPVLADLLSPPGASPSATPESPERGGESFWDSFPSSPFNKANQPRSNLPPPIASKAPWPLLTTLSLASNPLSRTPLTEEGFELPPRLINLDLSECSLTDAALPPDVLGRLRNLVELDLSRNDLSDDLFSTFLHPPPSSKTSDSPLFPSLRTLDISLNAIDTLASLESFLSLRVRRPITYVGISKPIQNLIYSEERQQRGGRRMGVPEGTEKGREGVEVEVRVRECMLRGEQARRRAGFPESESSREREKGKAVEQDAAVGASGSIAVPNSAKRGPPPSLAAPLPRPSSPPVSHSPTSSAFAPSPSTPSRSPARKPVVLEDWELEAAAGLSTPAGRRRAAAQQARERADRVLREKEEQEERREREEREAREEMKSRMARVKFEEAEREEEKAELSPVGTRRTESTSPPPSYSPRIPSSLPPSPPTSLSPARPLAPTILQEASSEDPAILLISSALTPISSSSAGRLSLSLPSEHLAAIPLPAFGCAPSALAKPSTADLNRNQLAAFPLRAVEYYGWGETLRFLNLSRNRIVALELLEGAAAALLPLLESLDLSHNHLPSSVASPSSTSIDAQVPLLSALANLAPALVTLNLQHNRLTTLSGISPLLFPPETGAKGVKFLNLSENKIADIVELGVVAKEVRYAKGGAEEKSRWRLQELDLSSNEINKLPPSLGHLPLSTLLPLTGNTFRLPRRDVFENAAERKVVPWCREWLESL